MPESDTFPALTGTRTPGARTLRRDRAPDLGGAVVGRVRARSSRRGRGLFAGGRMNFQEERDS